MNKKAEDIFERSVAKVVQRARSTQVTIGVVSGRTADDVGSLAMKEAAKRLGVPIIVKGKSEYHSEKLFGKVRP